MKNMILTSILVFTLIYVGTGIKNTATKLIDQRQAQIENVAGINQ